MQRIYTQQRRGLFQSVCQKDGIKKGKNGNYSGFSYSVFVMFQKSGEVNRNTASWNIPRYS